MIASFNSSGSKQASSPSSSSAAAAAAAANCHFLRDHTGAAPITALGPRVTAVVRASELVTLNCPSHRHSPRISTASASAASLSGPVTPLSITACVPLYNPLRRRVWTIRSWVAQTMARLHRCRLHKKNAIPNKEEGKKQGCHQVTTPEAAVSSTHRTPRAADAVQISQLRTISAPTVNAANVYLAIVMTDESTIDGSANR
ncbi:hypothetical protein ABZP36_029105 [Zizania latifolia]